MTLRAAAFAIPGDLTTLTGGYIYERRLLEGLRAQGRAVAHIQLGASWPDPTVGDMEDAINRLCAVEPARALILDGFISGAADTAGLARVRAPMVAMVHHPLALEQGLGAARRAQLFASERANLALMAHVLVPSPHTAATLVAQYDVAPGRITIARPGTDRPMVRPAPIDPPLILAVGIQHPRKGHDVLLAALAQIQGAAWQAVIAGGTYDAAHSAALARQLLALGLNRRVRFAGRVSAADLAGLYAQASIFALATRYEGYGIVFDEALSHGLPIVSCRTGAVPDTVPPEAGLLVPPDAPEAFARALDSLLQDGALRRQMARAAAAAGAQLPGWRDTAACAGRVLDHLTRL